MILETGCSGHSAIVKMQLVFNGTSIPIAQMGPDYIVVNSAGDHPPCDASIILKVDESERRWDVHLPDGISAGSKRVALSAPHSLTA
jgi:hypothetical protein